ncbi:MAG: DUF4349 domain-containing protein [Chloroflexia bacterium]
MDPQTDTPHAPIDEDDENPALVPPPPTAPIPVRVHNSKPKTQNSKLRRRRLAALGVIALVCVLLAAALVRSGARPSATRNISHAETGYAAPGLAAAAPTVGTASGADMSVPAAADNLIGKAPAPAGGGASPAPGVAQNNWDRKIIRTGQLDLTVANVESSLAAVRDLAVQNGGFLFSSNSRYDGDDMLATAVIQVPVDAFDSVMSGLRKMGTKVVSESTTSQDVSEEYTDLNSQVKNLQASELQLRALLGKATTVNDTLQVQNQLSGVQGQIEQLQGRINYLGHHSDLSTITVNLSPKPIVAASPPPPPAPGWQPSETASRAWNASLDMLASAGDVLITAFVFLWWLVPLALLAAVFARTRRTRRLSHETRSL